MFVDLLVPPDSVDTAHCWHKHSVRFSYHIWNHQVYVENWLSEATQYDPGFGSRVYQYRCIYLVSPHHLILFLRL